MKKKSKDCNDESSNNETFKKSEMCCDSSDNIKRKEKEEMDSSEVEVKKKKNKKKSKEMDSNVEEDLEGTGLCIKEFNLISEYKKDKKEKLLCSDRFIRNCFHRQGRFICNCFIDKLQKLK